MVFVLSNECLKSEETSSPFERVLRDFAVLFLGRQLGPVPSVIPASSGAADYSRYREKKRRAGLHDDGFTGSVWVNIEAYLPVISREHPKSEANFT